MISSLPLALVVIVITMSFVEGRLGAVAVATSQIRGSLMLQWLRKRSAYPDQTISEPIEVVPSRRVGVFSNLSSPKEARLRALFDSDHYLAPAVVVQQLSNCVIDVGNGLVVTANGSLDETCRHVASYYTDTVRQGLASDIKAAASALIEVDLIHVFHRSCGAYGHFILDGLCAVAVLSDIINSRRLKVLVPAPLPGWVTDILVTIGFDASRIVKVNGVASCRSLTISTMLKGGNCFLPNPNTIAKLRAVVGAQDTAPSRRIYLTRDDAHSPRFVENEAEVQATFAENGFEIIKPTSLSFRQQVDVFSSAKVIAGSHGSALANMVFAPPGAQIIDLMPEDWVGYWGDSGGPERWLLNLTGACDHDYSLILSRSIMTGDPYLPDSSTELARIDTTVDIDAVRAALRATLSRS